ncbi:MAG: tetraacyldisaccharide 4'-kinase [Pseudomonadota bacterium]
MRAPAFWYASPGFTSSVLAPLAALYAAGTARRLKRQGYRPSVPVVCVGNLSVGGTGKTPTVMDLVQRLAAMGKRPQILSRGYGGRLQGPVQVDPARHTADDVGDEPLLLAAFAPVWVAKDRAAGAQAAEAAGADIIVMDDGFQNPEVAKDAGLVVVDAARGFGNGRVIPAGPLREPIGAGLARASGLVLIGDEAVRAAFRAVHGERLGNLPVHEAVLQPLPTGMPWQGLRAFAFAGIGHPERFFQTLKALGADVVASRALDDHQPLTNALAGRLLSEARALAARPVTTEKDAVRLPQSLRSEVLTLPVRLQWADAAPVDAALNALFP